MGVQQSRAEAYHRGRLALVGPVLVYTEYSYTKYIKILVCTEYLHETLSLQKLQLSHCRLGTKHARPALLLL